MVVTTLYEVDVFPMLLPSKETELVSSFAQSYTTKFFFFFLKNHKNIAMSDFGRGTLLSFIEV